jgi:predicted MPP superfamily phosphohydrolase
MVILLRLGAALALWVVTLAAHGLLGRWLWRAFPGLPKGRKPLRQAFFCLSLLQIPAYALRMAFPWLRVVLGLVGLELIVVTGGGLLAWALTASLSVCHRRSTPSTPASLERRRLLERVGGLAAFGLVGGRVGWGIVRGRHGFVLEEVEVRVPGLPRVLDGYTIAQVSDLHTGLWVGGRELDEGLALVRRARPDLVVATGDLVDFDRTFGAMVAGKLAGLPARDGVFAILGNHDYYTGIAPLLAELQSAGLRWLVNEGCVIRPHDGGGFALLGVDDAWAPRLGGVGPRLDRALAMVPPDRPRILLAHQPAFFHQAAGQVALQLSGHTHGGQINPGFRPASLVLDYVAGRYQRKGSTLWVNRGFGVAGPPARIGAPPEVTRIILVAA